MSSNKLLILAAAFAAMVWLVNLPGLDPPEFHSPVVNDRTSSAAEDASHDAWTTERRAAWRDQVDHRRRER